jgi:hypothetical protein
MRARELPASGYALEVNGKLKARICDQGRRHGKKL